MENVSEVEKEQLKSMLGLFDGEDLKAKIVKSSDPRFDGMYEVHHCGKVLCYCADEHNAEHVKMSIDCSNKFMGISLACMVFKGKHDGKQ